MHGLTWPPEPPALTDEPGEDEPSEDNEAWRRGQATTPTQAQAVGEAASTTDAVAIEESDDVPHTLPGGKFWSYDAVFESELQITRDARLVFLNLCRRANKSGTCWPSQRGIAANTGVAGQSIRKLIIPELEAHGLIEHTAGSRSYQIQPPEKWRLQTEAPCCVRASSRAVKAAKAAGARWVGSQTLDVDQTERRPNTVRRTGRADPVALAAILGPDWDSPAEDDE
jgi:DNA-binding transcriptional regulator YhcF (GntR family)